MDLLWFIYVDLSRSLDKNDHPGMAEGGGFSVRPLS